MKRTIEDNAIAALKLSLAPLAEHEFGFCGTNGSGLTACLRRMRNKGLVLSCRRARENGKLQRYKEWSLTELGRSR